ncbi:A24 family peptidase [Salinispirillum sp. LH 10-3-1]|uniref:Prepilin leader peptidase/N-methyltransferase n=1 Tax=Salinispirillum sp. LH 10-3-1 TaxID=2952525 RepID=A0AB38YI57_9GAMM
MQSFIVTLQQMPAIYYALALLFGLCIGSFLNVVIHRLPKMLERAWQYEARSVLALESGEAEEPYNLAVPRSACPSCGHRIRWFENLPVVSYLFLRGRCSACGASIGGRYPLVELLTAALTVAVALSVPPSLAALLWMAFVWALVALTFIDLDTQLLPDQITLPLLWLGLLLHISPSSGLSLDQAVIGAAAGYGSLWLVFHAFRLLTGKEGMGYGDFKLFAVFGAWFGWQALPLIILLSSVVGAIAGLLMMLLLGRDRQIPIAFGPYLCGAALVYLFWGEQLVQGYLAWAMG